VRDELEHLLDDEMDMAEMYLTEKLTRQEISETSSRVEVDDPSQLEVDRDEDYRSEADVSNGTFIGYKPHIEELEMLLEAYFVQIDGTLNKLSHVMTLPFPVPCIAPKCSYNLLFVVSKYITNESTIL
jgi:hypothetical protein